MAKSAIIGALRVNLGIDSAQFTDGLKKAQGGLAKFGVRMAAIGAAMSTLGAGLALGVRSQLNAADEMAKAARSVGVPVEELSALAYAGDLSGVSLDQLKVALQQLSRNMAQSSQKFEDLGIAVRDADGDMRPTREVLDDLADLFASMPDGAKKTAIAMDLMGRSGAEMVSLLNGGAAAMKELTDEAERLGLVITKETAEAAEQFNDNLERLRKTITGTFTVIASELAPHLAAISDMAVRAAAAFQELSPAVRKFIGVAAGLAIVLGPVLVGLGLTIAALGAIPTLGVAAAVAGIVAGIGALGLALAEAFPKIQQVAQAFGRFLTETGAKAWTFVADVVVIFGNLPRALWVIWRDMLTAALDAMKSLGQVMLDGAIRAKDWFIAEMSAILDWLATLPAKFLEIGGNIIQGMVDGIKMKWEELKASVLSLGESLPQWMKDVLGIASPSRVFAEIGRYIAEGLGLGVEGGIPKAIGAVQRMADGVIEAGQTMGDQLRTLTDGIASGITGLLQKMLSGAKITLDDISQIISQIANQLFIAPFMTGLQSGISGLIAGAFAGGGFIGPGQIGLVGEEGPELISGGRHGATITPMDRAGGGGSVTQVFNISTPDPNAFRASQRQISRRARAALQGA